MRNATESPPRTGDYTNRELVGLLSPLFRPHKRAFVIALLLIFLVAGLTAAGPYLIKHAIDHDIRLSDFSALQLTVLVFFIVQVVRMYVTWALRVSLEKTGQQMMSDLRKQLFRHLLELPLSFHDRHAPGELLSRVESDTQALRMLFTTTAVMLLGDIVLFVVMFVMMAWVSMKLTLLVAVLLPVLVMTTVFFQRRIHPIFVNVRKKNSKLTGRLAEFLQSATVLQAFARTTWATRDFLGLTKAKFSTQLPGERNVILWFNLMFLQQTIGIALIVGIGGYWAANDMVTIGALAMFIGYVRLFFEPLLRLSEQLTAIQRAFASAERIFKLLKEPVHVLDPEDPVECPRVIAEVRFEDVWFRYSEDADWVLRGVSFSLPAGQAWAVVGPTGSGKTTLINLLLRFYEPQRGRILIDEVDLKNMRQHDLRHTIGLVQQDIYLFPGNVRNNITLGDAESESRLEEVAARTGVDRIVANLDGGMDADLAERGENLSLGQRQLFSLARALVRDPRLVVLDEATSAIDPATEAALVDATRALLADRTAFIIAHRLSTVRDVDRILVLNHGEVVQSGTYSELSEQSGLFRTMHRLQHAET